VELERLGVVEALRGPVGTDIDSLRLLAHALPQVQSATALLQIVTKIRSHLSVSGTPGLTAAVDALLGADAVAALVRLLARDKHPSLQFECCWALTNIASSVSPHTRALVDAGALPEFVRLLASASTQVAEQAAWALGNIAGDGVPLRDKIIAAGAIPPLLALVTLSAPKSTLKNATWALSNLCRGKPGLPPPLVRLVLPTLAELITCDEKSVQEDALWALSYVTDGSSSELDAFVATGAVPRVAELLASPHPGVHTPALRAMGNLVTGNEAQTQAALEAGLLPRVAPLISSQRHAVRKEACWLVSNVCAGTPEQIQAVFACNLVPALIHQLITGESTVQREACWALANTAVGGTPQHINDLVDLGGIPSLARALEHTDPKVRIVALTGLTDIMGKAPEAHYARYLSEMEEAGVEDAINDAANSGNAELRHRAEAFLAHFFPVEGGAARADSHPTLVVKRLAGARLSERLASCTACWLAKTPCACASKAPHECAICQDADNDASEGPWTALHCGHLYHQACILRWAAHVARGGQSTVLCPQDRKCVSCVVQLPRGQGGEQEGHLRVPAV
jgi:hypothetical protein